MRKVLYTKFSRERRNEFQIMTRITEEDGIRRCVEASAAERRENSTSGICMKNYRKLEHLYAYAGVQICPCELDEEKMRACISFCRRGKSGNAHFPSWKRKRFCIAEKGL